MPASFPSDMSCQKYCIAPQASTASSSFFRSCSSSSNQSAQKDLPRRFARDSASQQQKVVSQRFSTETRLKYIRSFQRHCLRFHLGQSIQQIGVAIFFSNRRILHLERRSSYIPSWYECCESMSRAYANSISDTHNISHPSALRGESSPPCANIPEVITSTRIVSTQACISYGPRSKEIPGRDALEHRMSDTSSLLALVLHVDSRMLAVPVTHAQCTARAFPGGLPVGRTSQTWSQAHSTTLNRRRSVRSAISSDVKTLPAYDQE